MAVDSAATTSSVTRPNTGAVERISSPRIDVRVVLFTVSDGALRIACPTIAGRSTPALPQGRPTPNDSLDTTARRIVRDSTGVQEHYIEQLYSLSVDEPPIWTVIVGYMALMRPGVASIAPNDSLWRPVETTQALSAADQMVVEYAVLRLRAKLGYTNIAFFLLSDRFTLSELQETYEIILAHRLDKRNFRRRVIASGIVEQTNEKRREGSHRPATLYQFTPADDRETYLTPPWAEASRGE